MVSEEYVRAVWDLYEETGKIWRERRMAGSTRGDFVAEEVQERPDPVDHPPHYTDGPGCQHCGKPVECITVTERMPFNLGNAVKYIWRHDKKGNPIQDLKKARWYVDREIKRMGGE